MSASAMASGEQELEPGPPSAGGPWTRRVQHVRLRTKIVVPMVLLAVAPAIILGAFTIPRMRGALRAGATARVEFDAEAKARAVRDLLEEVQQDVRFLGRSRPIVRVVAAAAGAGGSGGPSPAREEAARELLDFSQGKRTYCRVRLLTGAGSEVLRLSSEEGAPAIVPSPEPGNASGPPDVLAALALEPGRCYVSEMEPDPGSGRGPDAGRPLVRYVASLADGSDGACGLVAIDICVGHLLARVGRLPAGTEAWLVDRGGTYLGSVGGSEEKRGLAGPGAGRTLSADFGPGEAAAILGASGRLGTLETAGAFVAFAPVPYDEADPGRRWVLLVAYPRAAIEAPVRQVTALLLVATAAVAALAGVAGVLIGHYVARPVARLRRATREIASGDLSRRVEVATGDEIEALAADFNVMAERLDAARRRLAAWNAELEREVARKTADIQRLRSGLARTDRLASLGQMTAGVVHEVGNPLAAMKAKIQVADRTGALCAGCRPIAEELVCDVDRLTGFLRSFSRFIRLREPRLDDVAMGEVARDLATLVAPELKERGVRLRVEAPPGLPALRADPDQLRHVVVNLVLNAAEATPGEGEVLVRLDRAGPADGVRVQVIDRGTGMPPEVLEKVFDPFFTTKPEGTGLGLAISRQIVEDHGGRIVLSSAPEEGTTATVTLPASPSGERRP